MYIGTKGSDVRILNETVVSYNHAGKKGGAINIVGSTLAISNTNIYNNSAHLGGIISACKSDVKLHAYDNIVISRDPKILLCMYYDETLSIGGILSSQPELLSGTTTSHRLHSHVTTDPTVKYATVKPTKGYQSNTHSAVSDTTTSYQLYYTHITTDPTVRSATVKPTEGYQSSTRPTILHGNDKTPAVIGTPSSMTIIMIAVSSFIILLCLIVVVVRKIGRKNGKITVKKYTLNGLCIGHRYRPVVDLDNDHNNFIVELTSGHLLSTTDNINLLSDNDEEL